MPIYMDTTKHENGLSISRPLGERIKEREIFHSSYYTHPLPYLSLLGRGE